MHKKHQKQMPLIEPASGHPQEMELEIISLLIDSTPTICGYVLQDLNEGKVVKRQTGAQGMSADQVLRTALVMRLYSFTYEQLAFHIYDSRAFRRFCRIGIADKGFGKSALNANIKRISPHTWERISQDLLEHAKDENIEKGRKARIDYTVVESCIESGISWLKRSFGLTRCTWKGFRSFKSYVLSSVVAANLLTIARKKLAAI